MKILVVLASGDLSLGGEDTFKLDSISSKSYSSTRKSSLERNGSVHYIVKYNKEFLEKIVPEEELVETKDFTFIKGWSFVDGTDYYKVSVDNKEYKFSPKEVFFS